MIVAWAAVGFSLEYVGLGQDQHGAQTIFTVLAACCLGRMFYLIWERSHG